MGHRGIEATVAAEAGVQTRMLVLRWEISTDAIRMSPLPEIAAMNGQAERISRAVLEWRVDGDGASASLRLEIGEDDLVVPLGRERGAWVEDGEFAHGDFGDALRLSLRSGVVTWVRTGVLKSALGLGGGVYEGPSVDRPRSH